MFIRFDRIHEHERQMDTRTPHDGKNCRVKLLPLPYQQETNYFERVSYTHSISNESRPAKARASIADIRFLDRFLHNKTMKYVFTKRQLQHISEQDSKPVTS